SGNTNLLQQTHHSTSHHHPHHHQLQQHSQSQQHLLQHHVTAAAAAAAVSMPPAPSTLPPQHTQTSASAFMFGESNYPLTPPSEPFWQPRSQLTSLHQAFSHSLKPDVTYNGLVDSYLTHAAQVPTYTNLSSATYATTWSPTGSSQLTPLNSYHPSSYQYDVTRSPLLQTPGSFDKFQSDGGDSLTSLRLKSRDHSNMLGLLQADPIRQHNTFQVM
ncbi:hypothetical protein EGW08_020477, partial [Elysia chlorotica]